MSEKAQGAAQPPVVVVGANENGLSIARSLGRRGVQIFGLGCPAWLCNSRYIEGIGHDQPDCTPSEQLEVWLDWLLTDGAERHAGSVLFPCNDVAVEMVARNHAALSRHYLLDESLPDVSLLLLDKVATYDLANRVGVEAPRVWELPDREAFHAAVSEVKYPCALKPTKSVDMWQRLKTKLLMADNEAELREAYDRIEELGIEVMLTEYVAGADDQYYSYWTYVDVDGDLHFHFTKRKFRQYPIHSGLGTLHKSWVDAETRELGERFVRGSGLRGIAVVEFKRDAGDGRLKLMECNVRFTKSNDVVVRSGIDLPYLVYQRAVGRPISIAEDFRDRVGLWWPREDVWALRQYRAEGELGIGGWLRSLWGRTYVPIFAWDDPKPSSLLLYDRMRERAKLLAGRS